MHAVGGRPSDALRKLTDAEAGTALLLSMIRAAKVRSAADLMVLSDLVTDPERRLAFGRHARDEARHADQLLEVLDRVGCRIFRLPAHLDSTGALLERSRARDMKHVYAERGVVGEVELMELTIAMSIAERDTLAKVRAASEGRVDMAGRRVLHDMSSDDHGHVRYLRGSLDWFERRFSRRAVSMAEQRLEALYGTVAVAVEEAVASFVKLAAA